MYPKRALAFILTITAPIWIIPAAILGILAFAIVDCYTGMLDLLEGHACKKKRVYKK